jgi:hypothetical protein
MAVGEAESLPGQAVEVRGGYPALRIIGGEITEALIVGEDHDDVRSVRGNQGKRQQKAAEKG